jgi:hypothetical protein
LLKRASVNGCPFFYAFDSLGGWGYDDGHQMNFEIWSRL